MHKLEPTTASDCGNSVYTKIYNSLIYSLNPIIMKKKVFSLMMTLVLAFFGIVQAQAQPRETVTSFNFEDHAIPSGWSNDATYPWTVVTPAFAGYNGSYAMMSGNAGVTSSTSAIEATVTYAEAGTVSFLGGCWGEGSSYDVCRFYIDNVEQFAAGNLQTWGTYTFPVAAGTHTFRWSYSKDSSVNPTGDCFYVDDVTFTSGGGSGIVGDYLTVHDATTTNSYVPIYGLWVDAYQKCEMIYPADELVEMVGSDILSLKYYSSSSVSWPGASFQVFLKEVSNTTINDFTGTAGATIVYEGSLNIVGSQMTIEFTEPYRYNGGNLLVGVYEPTTGSYSSCSWYGETVNGASVQNYSSSGLSSITATQRNFLPKTTFNYVGGGTSSNGLIAMQNDEMVEVINVGSRPNGYWMEPFVFQLKNEGPRITVTNLDVTPDEYFTIVGPELPLSMSRNDIIDVTVTTGNTSLTEWQFVALYDTRVAAVWPIVAEPYDPAIPDVWELACEEATTFPFVEVPARAHNTTLHNDYTLPFPEIPEGYDAVYKLTFNQDQVVNAYVSNGANGKVALYTQDFFGEGGPMATNNYVGDITSGGAAAAPFEAQIGEGTSTTGYFPFYTYYNYSIATALYTAAEMEEAGVTRAPMTSMSFYATNAPGYAQQGISIWMANVADTEVSVASPAVSGMTLVYTGSCTPAIGWNEFAFNEGTFTWDGSSNVLIFCQRTNGSWNTAVQWQAHNPGFYGMGYLYNDGSAYDVTANTYNMNRSNTARPNIILKADGRNRDNVLFADDFEGGMSNWTLVDADGDGDAWLVFDGAAAHSGLNVASSWSWDGYSMDPDNYMISPMVEGATSVNYFVSTNTYYPDHYAVMVSTTGMNPSDFSIVYEEDAYRGSMQGGSKVTSSSSSRDQSAWMEKSIALPAGTKYVAFRHYNSYDMNYLFIDDVTIFGADEPVAPVLPEGITAGPVIANLPVRPGTYYLVASSTDADFEVTINAEDMPCPAIDAEGFAFNPMPADNEDGIEPGSVTLRWQVPTYATGWRLIFGTTYHPEANHPQTIIYPEDGSFTNNMANSYTVRNLWNNNNYFWRVEFNNGTCPEGVSSPVWGFTTHLNIPQNLTVVDETVFNDEAIVLNWNAVVDRTYRMYNVYRDGELIGHTTVNNISNTTYTDGPLPYNMNGYTYCCVR